MAGQDTGYAHLVARHGLDARPVSPRAVIDPAVRGRKLRGAGSQKVLAFEQKYRPEDTLVGHLQFALRYEGVNLEVLALLFERAGRSELTKWLAKNPASAYARRAGFLYEWLTGDSLGVQVSAKERYAPLADGKLQFCLEGGERNAKFRVLNNLPGNREFCPLVRRTAYLDELAQEDLRKKTREKLAQYDPDLLRRAASYLYLKETHASFEVERESPSPSRARRFTELLRGADTDLPLTEERLAELQRAVIDPRFHEFGWRTEQNWLGKDHGYRKQVDFVPRVRGTFLASWRGYCPWPRRRATGAGTTGPGAVSTRLFWRRSLRLGSCSCIRSWTATGAFTDT